MMINKTLKVLTLLATVVSLPLTLLAQLPPDPYDNVDDVPLDGGVAVLVAFAIVYGIVRMMTARKKKKLIVV